MGPKVYVETSVVSYLAGRPSRDLLIAARQQVTADWWSRERPKFDVYVSEVVVQEAQDGDDDGVRRRLAAMEGIPVVAYTTNAVSLARTLLDRKVVPLKAASDAAHIAIAASNGMDFLLTWNFRHIANAFMRVQIERVIRSLGLESPVLCTPEELLETQ